MISALIFLIITSVSSKLVIDFARFLFDLNMKKAKFLSYRLKAQNGDQHHDQAGRADRGAGEGGGRPGGGVCHQRHLAGRSLPASPGR